ncbi:PilN domain-containing protein [Candidatus Amarobacter glycogenicus]|uniref:PilN domain-containing protein n=1 Tax=Candidatus Amarobacter glycogenicus TaxID=3140699 RepID=UPI002A0D09A2|nr:PilN domain-containing protein [Dehalococcoidia bacterium]
MDAIKTDANQITLLGVEQADNRLTISGEAADDTAVIAYAQELEASGQFARIVVQSITLLPTPQPVITPTLSPSPTATTAPSPTTVAATATSAGPVTNPTAVPTITPTPNLRDAYEVDDSQAKPIFVGEVQTRNFYPRAMWTTPGFWLRTAVFTPLPPPTFPPA